MGKTTSITAKLALDTSDYQKGLRKAEEETAAFKRRMDAAAAFTGGGPAIPRAQLDQRMRLEAAGFSPISTGSQVTGLNLRKFQPPPIDRAVLTSQAQWNHLVGTGVSKMAEQAKGFSKLKAASSNAGMGILEVSRALEDAQYGMKGVMNNIPGMVMAFGGTAGLAGAASLVAVSFYALYQSWNYLQESLGNQEPETVAALRQRQLAEALQETKRRSDEAVEAYDRAYGEGLAQRREGALDYLDRELEGQNKVTDATLELARARAAALEGADRMRATAAAESAAEIETLNRTAALTQKKLDIEQDYVAASLERLRVLKEELQLLPKMSRVTVGADGSRQTRIEAQDPAKEDALKRKIAIEEATLASNQARMDELNRSKMEQDHYRSKILPLKEKAAQQQIQNERAKETERTRADSVKTFWRSVEKIAADAKDAALKIARNLKEAEENTRRLKETREDAAVDHLRARGRGAAADRRQRKLTEERRAAQLMEQNPLMSKDEAARIAAQERIDSRRGIRGAPARQYQGLDAFKRGSMPRPDFPALENRAAPSAKSRRVPDQNKAAADPAVDAINRGTDRTVSAITDLKTALTPAVADKIKPAA